MMCQHCAEPPCVDVCPTGASFKRADGIVLVDRHSCIGCRYCMMACPYKARSFVHEPLTDQKPDVPRGKGCVEGCTLCVHRIDKGEQPACVEACAKAGHNAMLFGDLNDPGQRDLPAHRAPCATTQVRADLRLEHRRALSGDLTHEQPCISATVEEPQLLRAAGALAALVALARPGRRALHGTPRPRRHRHEQPGRLGPAACVRDLPDRGRLRRAQRGLDRLGVRQDDLQAARAAVGPAVRWPCWPAA